MQSYDLFRKQTSVMTRLTFALSLGVLICLASRVGSEAPNLEDTLWKALNTHWKAVYGWKDPCIMNVKRNVTKVDEKQFDEIIKGMKPESMHDFIECTADQLFVLTVLCYKREHTHMSWENVVIELDDQPPDGLTKVTLKEVNITDLYYSTYSHKPYFKGTIRMVWTDQNIKDALKYAKNHDLLEDILDKLKDDKWTYSYHSWYPKLETSHGEGSIGMRTRQQQHRVVNMDGQSQINFRLGAWWWNSGHEIECDAKYDHFPFDVHTCTFDILLEERTMSKVNLDLDSGLKHFNVNLDPKKAKTQPHWYPVANSASVTKVFRPNGQQGITISYQMKRVSSTIVAETILPLVLVTGIVVLVPLFLQWAIQMAIKLLGTILYMLLLFMLMRSFSDINNGPTTPRIVRAYDFLMYTTGVSAIITLVLYSLSKIERNLPPPQSLRNVTSMINTVLCCTVKKEQTKTLTEDGINNVGASRGQQEWEEVFQGINNIFLVMFTCIYILGIIIIGA